jgi:oxidase EvaA
MAGLQVSPVPLSRCSHWSVENGELRHSTGRYFQVTGARVLSGTHAGWSQPMIRQEEIGILAFLVRHGEGGTEWLLQAKTEPGNVGGTQIGPTVQATESNYRQVHGGDPTRYLEVVAPDGGAGAAVDLLASEQGTRFLHKRNRNLVIDVTDQPAVGTPDDDRWRWVSSAEVRDLLTTDFRMNTDARSVVVSAPWSLMSTERRPFGRWAGQDGFLGDLHRSHQADPAVHDPLALLEAARQGPSPATVEQVPLGDLAGWTSNDQGITADRGHGLAIRYVSVLAEDREVRSWCQPLMASTTTTECSLWCQLRDGVLQLLFRLSPEPGLVTKVELAPTAQSDLPSSLARPVAPSGATPRLQVLQSDEGGRFLRSVTRYSIVELPPGVAVDVPADAVWLNLAQVEELAHRPGTFTNEARSTLSLLLSEA